MIVFFRLKNNSQNQYYQSYTLLKPKSILFTNEKSIHPRLAQMEGINLNPTMLSET
jgi:hypothetical protein